MAESFAKKKKKKNRNFKNGDKKNLHQGCSTFLESKKHLAGHTMEWNGNFSIEYGIVKVWNERFH